MVFRNFTLDPKVLEVINDLPKEDCKRKLSIAVMNYGAFGEEPELEGNLKETFEAIRDGIRVRQ